MRLGKNPFGRPFPDRNFGRPVIFGVARTGLFVFLALLLLRPEGIRNIVNPPVTALAYGLITFLVGLAYEFFTNRVLGIRKSGNGWTLGWWIVDSAALLLVISLASFVFYNYTVDWAVFDWRVLLYIAVPTVIVGLLPITFSGMALQLRAEREHQQIAGQVQLGAMRAARAGRSGGELDIGTSTVDPAGLLFCEDRKKSVRFVVAPPGEIPEYRLPVSFAGLADRLAGSGWIRCHDDYLVNPDYITSAGGNAQGLRLKLRGYDGEVPVGSAYVASFRRAFLG